jgi:aspartyl-tRNA synthetase
VFQADYVGAVVMPGGASQPRKQLDAWQEWAKQRGAKGLAYVTMQDDGTLGGPRGQEPHREEKAGLAAARRCPARRLHLLRRRPDEVRARAARCRPPGDRRGASDRRVAWSFLWVNDAPLFEPASDAVAAGDVAVGGGGAWTAVHHAFTSPKAEFEDTFDTDPGPGAGLRLRHGLQWQRDRRRLDPYPPREVQERVFAVMGLTEEEAQEKFGFLLDAFAFGAPPHGGIAFGWDRIVMLLGGFDSDPRRHRLPEVRRRLRPADRRAGADHGGPAQGGVRQPPQFADHQRGDRRRRARRCTPAHRGDGPNR